MVQQEQLPVPIGERVEDAAHRGLMLRAHERLIHRDLLLGFNREASAPIGGALRIAGYPSSDREQPGSWIVGLVVEQANECVLRDVLGVIPAAKSAGERGDEARIPHLEQPVHSTHELKTSMTVSISSTVL